MFRKTIRSLFVKYNKVSITNLSMLERMSIATSKGAISQSLRRINENDPQSWEFSCFSQNGEDGIVEFLTSKIISPNRYFVEIGSSDGLENNTAFLAFVLKFSGVMIEGDEYKSVLANECLQRFNWGVKFVNAFVSTENIDGILSENSAIKNPDFLSLDIDGNDYYIMESILQKEYRPRIICVEYNSSYGPENSITIKYKPDFNYWTAHHTHWYYGVSISGWKNLFARFGYEFISVDTNGVNAFFVDPASFPPGFTGSLLKTNFKENFAVFQRTKTTWEKQFEQIQHLEYHKI